VRDLRAEFWENVLEPGTDKDYNKSLEKAGRLADSLEFAELMIHDALNRAESCGGHFREESQTEEGEARRDDDGFSHVSVWEYDGADTMPKFHKEPLVFENVELSQRSYK
jgi:succinate dehydrogenase / fumarate reductase flavoprotein subunit